jgi:hypothetical protein
MSRRSEQMAIVRVDLAQAVFLGGYKVQRVG